MKRKILSAIIACVLLVGASSALVGCKGKDGGPTHFSWWAVSGEPLHYGDYDNNPVVEYVTKHVQFKGEGGELKNISFDFKIPASTEAARKDFSNKINSRNFENIFDPTMYDGALADLYENNVILDLTPYVTDAEVMPNMAKFMEENPDMVKYMQTTMSDGSRKHLTIPGIGDALNDQQQAFGYNYRRDWLVKYGTQPATFFDPMKDAAPITNPKAGQTFKGAFVVKTDGTRLTDAEITAAYSQNTTLPAGMNGDSWEDDLLFPSGSKHPVYISDWQWMFGIYKTALTGEGITDANAYIMSLFYPGYIANGDFMSGFGGGGPLWYKDKNNNPVFGATSQGFRAYLECMNDWYGRKWIDQYFTEKTQPFYQTDNERVANGKVAVWMGNSSRIGTRLVNSGKHRKRVADTLKSNIKAHGNHMVTGFVGTPYLNLVLSDNNLHELAGTLLFKDDYPSWLYQVKKGATTIWERWNGILPNGDFFEPGMNSFNHYAYGSIGDWLYRKLAGIDCLQAGYKKILIKPQPIKGLDYVSAEYKCAYGAISSSYKIKDGQIEYKINIPANTTAEVMLSNGKTINIGSGEYTFAVDSSIDLLPKKYNMDSALDIIFSSPEYIEMLKTKLNPGLLPIWMKQAKEYKLSDFLESMPEMTEIVENILEKANK